MSQQPLQQELPLAYIHGKAVFDKPEDLYIPPDALEVILESFEGPLDLLLYLIRKQKLDIMALPIHQITRQYMEYIGLMTRLKLELAAEYLLMAALLAEIKSRLLLPRPPAENEDEEADPRAELIRRLQEYEALRQAALHLDKLPRLERDCWVARAALPDDVDTTPVQPDVSLDDLARAFARVLQRAKAMAHHHIQREALSTRERMSRMLEQLSAAAGRCLPFDDFFEVTEGRAGVVVTFLAMLELVKLGLAELVQSTAGGRLYLKSPDHATD